MKTMQFSISAGLLLSLAACEQAQPEPKVSPSCQAMFDAGRKREADEDTQSLNTFLAKRKALEDADKTRTFDENMRAHTAFDDQQAIMEAQLKARQDREGEKEWAAEVQAGCVKPP
jgi:hypothetical protein